jgi:hypothetical protein
MLVVGFQPLSRKDFLRISGTITEFLAFQNNNEISGNSKKQDFQEFRESFGISGI